MIIAHIADDDAAAVAAAAHRMAELLRQTVARRGAAHVAVSGGSTPGAMFGVLAALDVPWDRVELYQVDERVASAGDVARNATGLEHDLLDRIEGHRPRVHLMPVDPPDPHAYRDLLHERCGARLDVVHLGIGDDAHTASWPPGDPVADSADPVAVSGLYRGHVRLTLTPAVVNGATHVLVLAVGVAKRPAIERWLTADPTAPVSRLRRDGVELFCDTAVVAGSGR